MKRKFKLTPQVPLESDDMVSLFDWAKAMERRFPEIALLFSVPNGIPLSGPQRFAVINAFKRRGLKNGVPDTFLLVPRILNGTRFNGLAIEMKRIKGSATNSIQDAWLDALRAQGYKAEYCHGFKQAAELIVQYLLGEKV